eukprot:Clim_evm15s21 gene=Clim_evmTU15s21
MGLKRGRVLGSKPAPTRPTPKLRDMVRAKLLEQYKKYPVVKDQVKDLKILAREREIALNNAHKNLQTYRNAFAHELKFISESAKEGKLTLSQVSEGPKGKAALASKADPTISAQDICAQIMPYLREHILTRDQLRQNNFPTSFELPPSPLLEQTKKQRRIEDREYHCERCGKKFKPPQRDSNGSWNLESHKGSKVCQFHPGRLRRLTDGEFQGEHGGRQRGEERRYECCGDGNGSPGCRHWDFHVFRPGVLTRRRENLNASEGSVLAMDQIMETGHVSIEEYFVLPVPLREEKRTAYALDCEMAYTCYGYEMTRLTVIDCACSVVYDQIIKPDSPVVDYNEAYSGINADLMEKEGKKTRSEVLRDLANFMRSDTIIIGHGLENDMHVMTLLHDCLVDTSLIFPSHRKREDGTRFKRALKDLAREILGEFIQNTTGGHDSSQDAVTCMKLVTKDARRHTMDMAVQMPTFRRPSGPITLKK